MQHLVETIAEWAVCEPRSVLAVGIVEVLCLGVYLGTGVWGSRSYSLTLGFGLWKGLLMFGFLNLILGVAWTVHLVAKVVTAGWEGAT